MTPQEKAEQLVDRFSQITDDYHRPSKQCALIAVGEILEQLNHLPTNGYGMEYVDVIEYWNKVKTEIELL